MKKRLQTVPLLAASILLLSVPAMAQVPDLPETPYVPYDLVYARPFQLDEGFEYRWNAERPMITTGWLLVLEADPALAYPRETALPVLFVGDRAAHYASLGYPSGRILAFVPGDVDLASEPVWFGERVLPDRVTGEVVQIERQRAAQAGIAPFPSSTVETALRRGGGLLRLPDHPALEAFGRELYESYVAPMIPEGLGE